MRLTVSSYHNFISVLTEPGSLGIINPQNRQARRHYRPKSLKLAKKKATEKLVLCLLF